MLFLYCQNLPVRFYNDVPLSANNFHAFSRSIKRAGYCQEFCLALQYSKSLFNAEKPQTDKLGTCVVSISDELGTCVVSISDELEVCVVSISDELGGCVVSISRVVNRAGLFGRARVRAGFGLNFDENFGLISGPIRYLQMNFQKTKLFSYFLFTLCTLT